MESFFPPATQRPRPAKVVHDHRNRSPIFPPCESTEPGSPEDFREPAGDSKADEFLSGGAPVALAYEAGEFVQAVNVS